MMTSWKTTVGGLCAGIGTSLLGLGATMDDPHLKVMLIIIGTVLGAAGTVFLGTSARDNNKSSEDVGAGKQGQ